MKQIKVISVLLLFFAVCFGGRWEETDRIDLPKGLILKDFVKNYDGDIYLLGVDKTYKIDRRANQTILTTEATAYLAIPTHRHGLLIVTRNGNILFPGADAGQLNIPIANLGLPVDGAAFEDSLNLFIALLFPGRLIIYKNNVEQNSLNLQASYLSLIPHANYLNREVPFYTASNTQIYRWQDGDFSQPDYKGQLFLNVHWPIGDIGSSSEGQLFVALPDSILIYDQDGKKEEAIGSKKSTQFGKIYVDPSSDTIFVLDQTNKQIVVYVKKEKLPVGSGSVYLEKNQPNPLESYTDIEFFLAEPLDIKLVVYNLIGVQVKTLAQGSYNKGRYRERWDGKDDQGKPLPNGVYFYRLESKKGVMIRQLIILR